MDLYTEMSRIELGYALSETLALLALEQEKTAIYRQVVSAGSLDNPFNVDELFATSEPCS